MEPQEEEAAQAGPVHAAHRHNPYAYLMSGPQLDALLTRLGRRRAASVRRGGAVPPERAPRGVYPRPDMAFVVMDPTAGPWVPTEDAVLATITVGRGGSAFVPYAAAKAAGHRRLGRNYGEAVLVDPHLCGTGAFRYGHSAEVRGLIVGASGQSPDQDLYEAGALAIDLIAAIAELHLAWEERVGPGEWFTPDGLPPAERPAVPGA
ncbi:hypothetical protein ACFWAR_25800 [Streptomyces sp. NPDC059917]|uniref:hypothetical protein n=1 Tax=Streptomyces sp. NPDC059917 TaxID=3347002 RepID=UPI0036575EF6